MRKKVLRKKGYNVSQEQILKILDYVEEVSGIPVDISIKFKDGSSENFNREQLLIFLDSVDFGGYRTVSEIELTASASRAAPGIIIDIDSRFGIQIRVSSDSRDQVETVISKVERILCQERNFNNIFDSFLLSMMVNIVFSILLAVLTVSLLKLEVDAAKSLIIVLLFYLPVSLVLMFADKLYTPIVFIDKQKQRTSRSLRHDIAWAVSSIIVVIILGVITNKIS